MATDEEDRAAAEDPAWLADGRGLFPPLTLRESRATFDLPGRDELPSRREDDEPEPETEDEQPVQPPVPSSSGGAIPPP